MRYLFSASCNRGLRLEQSAAVGTRLWEVGAVGPLPEPPEHLL
jgi:hypothetical protein